MATGGAHLMIGEKEPQGHQVSWLEEFLRYPDIKLHNARSSSSFEWEIDYFKVHTHHEDICSLYREWEDSQRYKDVGLYVVEWDLEEVWASIESVEYVIHGDNYITY